VLTCERYGDSCVTEMSAGTARRLADLVVDLRCLRLIAQAVDRIRTAAGSIVIGGGRPWYRWC